MIASPADLPKEDLPKNKPAAGKERFHVVEFTYPSGKKAFRVTGYRPNGARVRENFKTQEEACRRQAELEAMALENPQQTKKAESSNRSPAGNGSSPSTECPTPIAEIKDATQPHASPATDPASGNLQTTAGAETGEAAAPAVKEDGTGLDLIRSFYAKLSLTAEDEEASLATFYKWRHKFGGLEVSDAKRLRLVEDENRKLKILVADQALDMMVLQDLLAKKF